MWKILITANITEMSREFYSYFVFWICCTAFSVHHWRPRGSDLEVVFEKTDSF